MPMRCLQVLALCLAHAAAGFAAASMPATRGAHESSEADRYQIWKTGAVRALTLKANANSLATAAALLFSKSTPKAAAEALDLAGRASELAPENAAIGWLRLRLCMEAQACDFRTAATAMRWLDADNAADWLPTLAAAYKDKDITETARVIADMAQGKRFDIYWNRLVVLMADALKATARKLPKGYSDSDSARLVTAEGIAGAEMVPPFSTLIDVCRDPPAGGERYESCLKLAKILQQGDSFTAQTVGLTMERRLLPADSKEARALGERRHTLDWRMTMAAKFDTPLLPWMKNSRVRWRLARMRTLRREEDVCIAVLREQGLPTEPPGNYP
jgi:hypothetical protein